MNRITPVPSQILTVYYNDQPLNITLDSGATVSFIRLSVAIALNCTILPNTQLALLADEKTRLAALGEINITLSRANFSVLLRALVVKNLQADCFGGTNFHKDNDIETRITTGQIKVHHKFTVLQTNPVLPLPSSPTALNSIQTSQPPPAPISIQRASAVMPGASLLIPLPSSLKNESHISIQPLHMTPNSLPPQICPVLNNAIPLTNHSEEILLIKKKDPLLATPVSHLNPFSPTTPHLPSQPRLLPPPRPPDINLAVNINTADLNHQQIARIHFIHQSNQAAFNSDLSSGYNHKAGKYFAVLRFKEDSRPEAKSLDVPQYNRQCASLQQALMDRLEQQNVLVNPHDHGIEVKSVSPSWVIQKGSAKTKCLKDCTIDELRWVVAFNNLNSHLLPKPAKVSSLTKAVKFLARWKFHILADLHNSYFQIHIAKKHWCWLGVMTPFRGLRVLTRLGQGLLNSEGELDELLAMVLGDHLTSGICEIARDDIQVGGNTHDEAIDNWNTVLSTLADNGLKLSPRKVRVFPKSTEVYGVKLENNTLSPSDHVLTTLGITSISQLKTAKDVNAWRGLYKTLLHNLPTLAAFMHPFDIATASMSAKQPFVWSPELTAAFNAAQDHLKNARALALPAPHEQLVLQPDGAQRPPAIGWVLSVIRQINGKSQLVPVQYCSAKLKPHMQFWSPCEIEAVATNVAVEQCSPWIMEATNPTYVCPDSKAVVQAANRMAQGKMSTNPRLQNLLACINRRPVLFHHSSAKLGQHLLSDTCSRTSTTCSIQDCSIERFLDDLPLHVELMAVGTTPDSPSRSAMTATSLFTDDIDPAIIAATSNDTLAFLSSPTSALPLGSFETWRAIQEGDPDTAVVLHCKKSGDSPRKRSTNPAINRFFAAASVKNGVLVVPQFDKKTMRNIDKLIVPQSYLPTLLTVIHIKCNHPSRYQMEQIFQRYFFAPPGLDNKLSALYEQCFTCQSIQKLKPSTHFAPPASPEHPGTHMQADVIKHDRQLILVTTDLFSNFTTSCFIASEQKQHLLDGLIQTTTPIRRSELICVRTDRAPALQSLALRPPEELSKVGIKLILPDTNFNKNANAKVDKIIQELQTEMKKNARHSQPLSNADLAMATSILNNRIRKAGFTAGEIQFARDFATDSNLIISDSKIRQSNIDDRLRTASPPTQPPTTGDMVLIKSSLPKMATHSPFMVTNPGPSHSSLRKILHTHSSSPLPTKISPFLVTVKNSDLHPLPLLTPKNPPSSTLSMSFCSPPRKTPPPAKPPWIPNNPSTNDSDSDSDLPTPKLINRQPPPPPPPPLLLQQHLLHQVRNVAAIHNADPILPHLRLLFDAHRAAVINSRPPPPQQAQVPHPPDPPPAPPPPPPLPDPPAQRPARRAKLFALQKITRPIPQLEGAELTPETTPDTSLQPPSTPRSSSPPPHPLSPLEPWSPPPSPPVEPSFEWDHQEESPSFNLFPDSPALFPLDLALSSPHLSRNRVYNVSAWLPLEPGLPALSYQLFSEDIQPNLVYDLSDVLPVFLPPADNLQLPPQRPGRFLTLRRLLRRLRRRQH